jgi:hypothetical protein
MNNENKTGIPAVPAPDETAEVELNDEELETLSGGAGGFTLAFNASKNANNGEG